MAKGMNLEFLDIEQRMPSQKINAEYVITKQLLLTSYILSVSDDADKILHCVQTFKGLISYYCRFDEEYKNQMVKLEDFCNANIIHTPAHKRDSKKKEMRVLFARKQFEYLCELSHRNRLTGEQALPVTLR